MPKFIYMYIYIYKPNIYRNNQDFDPPGLVRIGLLNERGEPTPSYDPKGWNWGIDSNSKLN